MPRIPRGLAGGEVYHIINRGNRKNEVFHEARDCEIFTTLMQRAKKMTAIKLYAYALMPNHFHFPSFPRSCVGMHSNSRSK